MANNHAFLYLIRLHNTNECFYKIGISVHKFCRFYQIMKAGYDCEIIYMLCGSDYLEFLRLECILHNIFKRHRYKPKTKFGGHTECYDKIDVEDYIKYMRIFYPFNINVIKNLPITWR